MAQILVVDDTKNIRKMVAVALSQVGHSVEVAENGAAGLQTFGDGAKWDLTLVDQQMPELAGDEFVEQARERDPMARVVMMTAFATNELAAHVLSAGATDFLRKPFTTEILRGAVEVALSHPRHFSPVSTFDSTEVLPQPGEEGFVLPRVSWRINGFSFWPISRAALAQGFELGRFFQIRAPQGNLGSCFVGITPHIRAEAQTQAGHEIADDDPFWEKLCAQTLLNFLAQNAKMPPEVLPVFDKPSVSRSARGGLVPWGPFAGE